MAQHRFSIHGFDALTCNPKGSLGLYIQDESLGAAEEPNWLPAPESAFSPIMRLYVLTPQVLDGCWKPSAVERSR